MEVMFSVTVMLVDLSVAIMQVTVSTANMWVTIFIVIMKVGVSVPIMHVIFSAVQYAYDCFYCNYADYCYSYVGDSWK